MGAYEPDLEELGGDRLGLGAGDLLFDPEILVFAGFAFDENGAQLALLGKAVEGDLVDGLLVLVQELDEIRGEKPGHFCENLVRFEHKRRGEVRI